MKKIIASIIIAGLAVFAASAQIRIATPNTEMIIDGELGGDLCFMYYGNILSDTDMESLSTAGVPWNDVYPVYGIWTDGERALEVTHSDGNLSTCLKVESVSTRQEPSAKVTVIRMKDTAYPFYVNVCYRAYEDVDMIETWAEIENREKKPVKLTRFDSGSIPVRYGNVWLTHLAGSANNEGRLIQEPLERGMLVLRNKDGVRNTHTDHPEVMFSLDGKPLEHTGQVIGAALCYSGNYELRVHTHGGSYHEFYAGINPDNSAYTLEPKEIFTTPVLAFTYSDEGHGGASRNFHRWARMYKLANGTQTRKILLNSWEGVGVHINEEVMDQMMGDIASMGGELFVMDDGWFGDKYPRNNDRQGLGDWCVDKTKLPNGVQGLISAADSHGIKFGLWIEPEMVNTESELYEKHPDWVIKGLVHETKHGRGGTQMVLDLSNPEVQDFIFDVVDKIMTENPDLDYIKWDANASVMNHGSQYLPKDKQSHLFIEYHRGLINVCERIRAKYPKLTMQSCATGGGRANYGLMPYFDEFWVSDNSDALQRIHIQWGTSYFYPANAMAAHISAVPNWILDRRTSLKYRIDVAMSGRLGMEVQPKHMTEEEKDFCRKAIAEYKKIRPVVQLGDLYRLVSPYEGHNMASLMYVTEDKSEAAFFWWKTELMWSDLVPRMKMAGLDPDKKYVVHELNRVDNGELDYEGKTFTGKFLMEYGLEMPFKHWVDSELHRSDWTSRVLHLVAE